MNIAEILTRVKRQFGDESGVQITDADIYNWINDAQREIAMTHNLLQQRAVTNAKSSVQEYGVPPNILSLHSVQYRGRPLKEMTIQEANLREVTAVDMADGDPTFYTFFARTITLYPAPKDNVLGALIMYYTKMPDAVTADATTLDIPEQYHNAIVAYCLKQAYELDENWQAAQSKNADYVTGMQELKDKDVLQPEEFYPSITYTSYGDHPAYDGWVY